MGHFGRLLKTWIQVACLCLYSVLILKVASISLIHRPTVSFPCYLVAVHCASFSLRGTLLGMNSPTFCLSWRQKVGWRKAISLEQEAVGLLLADFLCLQLLTSRWGPNIAHRSYFLYPSVVSDPNTQQSFWAWAAVRVWT